MEQRHRFHRHIPALPRHSVALVFTRMVSACLIYTNGGRKSKGPAKPRSSQSGRVIGPAVRNDRGRLKRTYGNPNLLINSPEGTWEPQDTGIPPEQQPSVDENPDTGVVAPRRPSSSPPAVLPLLQPVVPVPVGLSDKEIARLRAQTLGFPQSQTHLTLNVSQPETTSSANVATESGEASSS